MTRPVDTARHSELLDRAVQYAIEHGLSDLTLRPLADALGIMPNTLVHHFGSKEELLSAILNGVRERLQGMVRAELERDPGGEPLQVVWRWSLQPGAAEVLSLVLRGVRSRAAPTRALRSVPTARHRRLADHRRYAPRDPGIGGAARPAAGPAHDRRTRARRAGLCAIPRFLAQRMRRRTGVSELGARSPVQPIVRGPLELFGDVLTRHRFGVAGPHVGWL